MDVGLRERALRMLARREHSRAELRRKLAPHADSEQTLAQLLDALAASRLLADDRYAEGRIRARRERYGNAKLAHELRASGVDEGLIAVSLESAGNELARARVVWQRKFGLAPATRAEWLKQARFLQSRGFSSDTIRRLLKNADAPDPDE